LTLPQDKTPSNNNPAKKGSLRSPAECSSTRLKYLIESVETKKEKLAKTA
jgi:hypothetical protein